MKKLRKITIFTILVALIASSFWFFKNSPEGVEAGWWDYDWNYRKALTINHNQVAGDLIDFPLLVSFTDANLINHAQEDGDDFVFVDSDGKRLSHEVGSYASSTGELVAWVKIPTLSSVDDEDIYLYYGNQSTDSQEDSGGVWSNGYQGVWHLDETSGSRYDSTNNDNTLTDYNTVGYSGSGAIGTAADFELSNSEYLKIEESASNGLDIHGTAQTITLSAWINMESAPNFTRMYIMSKEDQDNNEQQYSMYKALGFVDGSLHFHLSEDGSTYNGAYFGSYNTSTWYYMVGVYDGSEMRVYINGNSTDGTDNPLSNTGIYDSSADFFIGARSTGGVLASYFDGLIDEARVSNVNRSQAWIQTEYNNQNNPELFFTVQAEEVGGGPVGYWSFDEPSAGSGEAGGVHDESSQGNHGTNYSATQVDESMCVVGKCLYFDGDDDYVEIGDSDALDLSNGKYTIQAWIKATGWGENNQGRIIDKGGGSVSSGWEFHINNHVLNADKSLSFNINNSGFFGSDDNVMEIDNKWIFVSIAVDNGSGYFYKNGKEIGGFSGEPDPIDNTYPVRIGMRATDLDRDFEGYIDEVKVYPYARTSDQIKQDYNAGLSGVGGKKGVSASFGGGSDSWMSDGLVGYWKMDESTTLGGAIDSSGNGNDGTYEGTASTTVGKFGRGGVFDGDNDCILMGDVLDFERTESFSVGVWVKTTGIGTPVGKMNSISPFGGYDIYIYDTGWNVNLRYVEETNAIKKNSNIDVNDGEWHYLLMTYDGSSQADGFNLYTDGILDNGTVDFDNLRSSTLTNYDFSIGCRYNTTYITELNGQIDEVRVYNRVLSAAEVRKLYEWAPGPVLHFKMDEMEGGTAYDNSGNGNDGTINGANWNVMGKYGSALEFGAVDDYVDIGTLNDFALRVFSIGAWVKVPTSIPAGSTSVISRRNTNDANYIFQIYNDSHSYSGVVDFAFVNIDDTVETATGTTDLRDTEWHYVVAQYDGTNQDIYVDGTLEKSEEANMPDESGTQYFYINQDYTVSDTGISGLLIDDVRVYNYARTQKQILEDMNGGQSAINSPILDLSFDEGFGKTAHDGSGNGNDGTLYPGTSGTTATSSMWSKDGKVGGAMEFDGTDDKIDLSSALNMDVGTISHWVRPVSSDSMVMYYVSNGTTAVIYNGFGTGDNVLEVHTGIDNNGNYSFFYQDGDSNAEFRLTGNSVVANEWIHMIITWDTSEYARLYQNGELIDLLDVSSINFSGNSISTEKLGEVGDASERFFDGTIDEVKMYNYALTVDEVETLYNQGKSIVMGEAQSANDNGTIVTGANIDYCIPGDTAQCDPPVLELKMDKMSGSTVYDTSGNGNDGTINGASWNPVGKRGSALSFDGVDDYISFGDVENDFRTIEFFMKIEDTNYQPIFENVASRIGINFSSQIESHWGSGITNYYVNGIATQNIFTNEWMHVVITDTVGESLTNLDIGLANGGVSEYFIGQLDNILIYDYVRTPAQISYDYNRGKPVAYYKFDECGGSVIHDESGNGNHGTLNLGTSGVTATGTCASSSDSFWYNGRDGEINSAGSFDGSDDYVEITDSTDSILDLTGQITVSAWVNPSTASGFSSTFRTILSKDMHSSQPYGLYWDSLNDEIEFLLNQGATRLTVNYSYDENINNWVNIIAIYDSSNVMIYVDGELIGSKSYNISLVTDDEPVRIGWDGDYGSDRYFIGKIDEVKIYNYALTAEQVKQDYAGGAVRFR